MQQWLMQPADRTRDLDRFVNEPAIKPAGVLPEKPNEAGVVSSATVMAKRLAQEECRAVKTECDRPDTNS
jgi:hypothetical protein